MIVCYGDSNTWGYNPLIPKTRYKVKDIYTSILKDMFLESDSKAIKILNRGIPARCASSEVLGDFKDGYTPFKNEFKDYTEDVKLFIIMLGTNDVKLGYNANRISLEIKKLIDIIIDNKQIHNILIISPSPLKVLDYNNLKKGQIPFEIFYNTDDQVKTSQDLAEELEIICKSYNNNKIKFLNGGNYWETSNQDGIHLEPKAHNQVAKVIYDLYKNI